MKIQQFEERKRQKIHLMKEEKEQKEVEECKFRPDMATRKKNEIVEPRSIEQFLQD